MNLYEIIKSDQSIVQRYQQIALAENSEIELAYHDLHHVERVAQRIEEVLLQLGYVKELIQEAKVAALLHDVGCLDGKKNHAWRSYEFAVQYFEEHGIEPKHKNDILEAIRIHSDGFDTSNTIAQVLIFSDKLDITKSRLALGGYSVLGIRQLQFIKEIQVHISKEHLKINFCTEVQFNKEELEEFYFMKKVYRAIGALADHFHLHSIIQFDVQA